MRQPRALCELAGIEHAIVQAPMAGGATTPELVAAVSNAGGLGSIGAAYLSADEIAAALAATRALTGRPFAVNLFAPVQGPAPLEGALEAMLEALRPYHEELGLEPPGPPANTPEPLHAQVQAVLAAPPAVFSFTFGIPPRAALDALRAAGTTLVGTATTVAEARALEAAGVDAIVAQGAEAGAHRGSFLGPFERSMVGTVALVPQVVDAVRVPVIASGGIADGRGIAAAWALGASGVQLGTVFLACEEAGIGPAYRKALLAATDDATAMTRAFSGRPARGLSNRFLEEFERDGPEPLPFPAQNALTRPLRAAAARQGRTELMSLWAGQAAALARPSRAADLVRELAHEAARIASAS